ncbi:hypothetical protein J2T13_000969 [Paenibacillus sp. DS2015]|uniref:stalk domain-containing protein n=1 Tax=Paenibacillus sp. DS2015 TaxID=3373917 RepID=UPI003D1C93EF
MKRIGMLLISLLVLFSTVTTISANSSTKAISSYVGEWQSVSPDTTYYLTMDKSKTVANGYKMYAYYENPFSSDELFSTELQFKSSTIATFQYSGSEENLKEKEGKLTFAGDQLILTYETYKGYKMVITLERKVQKIQVYIDGSKVNLSPVPQLSNATVLVPMRAIFEYLGAKLVWDQKQQTIKASLGADTITLKIGSKQAMVNGVSVQLTEAPKVINNNTFVPLRFVSEALGAKVKWDAKGYSVSIVSKK